MFFMKRSLLYVKRKKSKVLTIGAILLIVSTLVLTGLVIKSASRATFAYARNILGASVTYTTNMSSIMGDRSERVPGSGMGFTLPSDFSNISNAEIDTITAGTDLIKSTLINATLAANAVDFGYFSIDDKDSLEANDAMRPRMGASINIIGSGYEKTDKAFYNDTSTLVSGRYFTDVEISSGLNVIIIEKTIALLNELEVGDTLTVSKIIRGVPGSESTTSEMTFLIVGIYKTGTPTDVSATDFKGSFNLSENAMYAPFNTVLANNGSKIDSVTFTLNNPEDVLNFTSYIDSLDLKYRAVNANDAAYEKMVGPIESVSRTSNILVFVVIIAGGLIIGLLSILSLKDRKYELGVLLALGESRLKIILQLVFEMIIISFVSFSLAILISSYTAQVTSNYLLNSAIANQKDDDDLKQAFGNFKRPQVMDVEVIDSLSVDIDPIDTINMLVIGILIIIIGNISQAFFVLKANPKEILLER